MPGLHCTPPAREVRVCDRDPAVSERPAGVPNWPGELSRSCQRLFLVAEHSPHSFVGERCADRDQQRHRRRRKNRFAIVALSFPCQLPTAEVGQGASSRAVIIAAMARPMSSTRCTRSFWRVLTRSTTAVTSPSSSNETTHSTLPAAASGKPSSCFAAPWPRPIHDLARHDRDLSLTRYGPFWAADVYWTGHVHAPVQATGWQPTPWPRCSRKRGARNSAPDPNM